MIDDDLTAADAINNFRLNLNDPSLTKERREKLLKSIPDFIALLRNIVAQDTNGTTFSKELRNEIEAMAVGLAALALLEKNKQ